MANVSDIKSNTVELRRKKLSMRKLSDATDYHRAIEETKETRTSLKAKETGDIDEKSLRQHSDNVTGFRKTLRSIKHNLSPRELFRASTPLRSLPSMKTKLSSTSDGILEDREVSINTRSLEHLDKDNKLSNDVFWNNNINEWLNEYPGSDIVKSNKCTKNKSWDFSDSLLRNSKSDSDLISKSTVIPTEFDRSPLNQVKHATKSNSIIKESQVWDLNNNQENLTVEENNAKVIPERCDKNDGGEITQKCSLENPPKILISPTESTATEQDSKRKNKEDNTRNPDQIYDDKNMKSKPNFSRATNDEREGNSPQSKPNEFDVKDFYQSINDLVENHIGEQFYTQTEAKIWCKEISNHIREKIRRHTGDKFKIIVTTNIGPYRSIESTHISASCETVPGNDNFFTLAFQTKYLFIWTYLMLSKR